MPLYGIDISGYQPGIDLSVVPCDFVGIYISGGTASGNADGRRQVQQAIAEGKRIILYHFENDGSPGTAQQEAEWFLTMVDHVGPVPANTLYALDNETGNALNVQWQADWLNMVRAAKGRGVGMYAPFTNLIKGVYQPLRDSGFFIWEAAYVLGYQPINGYAVPGGRAPIPGGDPAIWQFTSVGRLNGWAGNLDLNIFFGGPSDWDNLAGTISPASSGTPTPIQEDIVTPDDISAIAKATADEILNRNIDREGIAGTTNVRAVVANFDASVSGIVATIVANTDHVTLTDAQVQGLADKLNTSLPAETLALLKSKL
jgi:lysozyme